MNDAPRTYSVRRETRRTVIRSLIEDDEAWVVCIDPQDRPQPDGTTSVSMGFPVLVLTGWVSEPEKIAAQIAALLQEKQL